MLEIHGRCVKIGDGDLKRNDEGYDNPCKNKGDIFK